MNANKLSQTAVDELNMRDERAAIDALKASHSTVIDLERALEKAREEHQSLCKAINNGSFTAPNPHGAHWQ